MTMLRDIRTVIERCKEQGKYRRVVLLGKSLGGRLAIMLAAEGIVDGLVSIAAPVRAVVFEQQFTPQQREELASVGFTTIPHHTTYGDVPFTLKDAFLAENRQLEPLVAARNIRCPTLVIHGTADTVVPQSESEDLLVALGTTQKELFLIGGGDHRLERPDHVDALVGRIVVWLHRL